MFSSVKHYFYTEPNENLSIRKVFKPLYIILSLFGLFPYSIKFNSKRGLTIITKSIYINSLCAVSYVLFMSSFLAIHVQHVYESIDEGSMTREVMTQMNYVVELVVSFLFCVTAYVCAFNNRCTFVKIINSIGNMIEPPNNITEQNLSVLRFKVNVIMMGFLIVLLLLQVCVNFTRDDPFWKMILVFVTFMLPLTIQFTFLCFYYLLILMLVVLLMDIREKIESITKEKINILDCCMKADAKILSLQYMETLYVKAFEMKSTINKAFQASILVTTIQSFHAIVSESHIIYHGLVIEKDFTLHPLINCSIWIVYQIVKIFILARSGYLLKQEIMKVGQTLHTIPTDKHDIRLLLEIQHFSTLMSHQNNNLTAYGLFDLDATLLSKIISSSAMYMIILVQFDKK
ncbi:uncharacterized protein LOC142977976 [Anticarsia gemmatalis]|uniref:uncharacterized protein LOC142977976 n=1 Tax=Anticarsia gemmatalis TaxID=129554 RepID=UPI003F76E700